MRVLKVEKGEEKVVLYPRADMGEIVGLAKGIQYYIIQGQPEEIEGQTARHTGYQLTEENDPDYPHLKIANRVYEYNPIEPEPVDEIQELREAIVILSKDASERTQDENDKIDDLKTKVETKKLR